jgi:hypothetical protein
MEQGRPCLFCNINATLKDQKAGGEDVVAKIRPEDVAETVKTALEVDNHYSVNIVAEQSLEVPGRRSWSMSLASMP